MDETTPSRILVTGADGFIGAHLVTALSEAGHHVICCVRRPTRIARLFPDLSRLVADFNRDQTLRDWVPRLQGIDVVVNAAGIFRDGGGQSFDAAHGAGPRALFEAARIVGVKRVIQISALGADEQAQTRFHLSKKIADDYVASLDLDWVILQPSIVYGPAERSMALFKAMAALPVVPLVGTGDQWIQPIHVHDLALAVRRLVEPSAPSRVRIAAVGPEPQRMVDLLDALRRWLGMPAASAIRVPVPLARICSRLGDLIPGSFVTTQALSMLLRGNTADPSPFIRATGVRPRRLSDALRSAPSGEPDRWHARLYFVKPLLRWSIAFVWIVSGIISAIVYPREASYALLARAGLDGAFAPWALYAAAGLDILLGVATLLRYRLALTGAVQIAVILGYSAIIAAALPEFWIHPFGPLTKNIPLIAATMAMMALEPKR